MSCSKPLPPFTFDVLYYLNRDQLERFSIVCRPLKNVIERYFQSKPYRVFGRPWIRGGSCALGRNNLWENVQWHPNQEDYSAQQFLAGQKHSIDETRYPWDERTHYSFAEMRPYLGPTVRIKLTTIYVAGDFTYNPEHIEVMESIAYLWRDGDILIQIWNYWNVHRIVAEDFRPILNSPTILQCRLLEMGNAHFSFKDYKVLYTVKFFEIKNSNEKIDLDYWIQFLEQPKVKPVIVLHKLHRESIDGLLDHLSKAFSSAVLPNAFKIVFTDDNEPLTEFRESNKTSGEMLELKKGLPMEYAWIWKCDNNKYTLERSSV